jgi:DNA invertase Pin-like site-specific DNA recombinase
MKAILLVRVSTEAQDFTEQEREIYQMAINDGYKPEDIIAICEKESGIKLAEEDRAGLNRMKELIEAGGVDCVYCWEVSRIARRKKINFSVLEYLTEHKVQLIIKNPSITLFNRDGSINEGAEVVGKALCA